MPGEDVVEERGVLHRGGERPDLVERAGEGDQPVARDAAVGGLHPDHAAERGGLADRATGVGAEAERGEAGRHGRRRAAAAAAGDLAGVARVARRPEGRVLRRAAHGELVHVRLAERDGPGGAQRRAPRSRRRAGASPPGSSSRRSSGRPGCRGCPSAPPAHRPAGPGRGPRPPRRRPRRPAPGPRRRGRCRNALSSPSPAATAASASSTTSRADRSPERTSAARASALRHGASPPMRGTRKRWSSTAGACGQHLVPVEAGPRLVGPQHVLAARSGGTTAPGGTGPAPPRRPRGRARCAAAR